MLSSNFDDDLKEFILVTKSRPRTVFDRLAVLCGSTEVADIAKFFGWSYNTAKNYSAGRLPQTDVLVQVAEKTGDNLNWLLTGGGPGTVPGVDNRTGVQLESPSTNIPPTSSFPVTEEFDAELVTNRLRVRLIKADNRQSVPLHTMTDEKRK